MSAPYFTKGPWVYKWFGGPRIGGGKDGATAICILWRSWRSEQPTRQERANRDLICAAPDLYAALEALSHGIEVTKLPAEMAHAKFALAKARGDLVDPLEQVRS